LSRFAKNASAENQKNTPSATEATARNNEKINTFPVIDFFPSPRYPYFGQKDFLFFGRGKRFFFLELWRYNMLLEAFVTLAFALFGIGLAVALMPVVRPPLAGNKTYLFFAENFCAVTTLVWLLASLLCPGTSLLSRSVIFFAVLLFGWFSIHFHRRIEDIKK
jgi:hypothetical protein